MNPELRAVLTEALGRHEFVPASFIADPKPARCACGEWCDSGPGQARVRHNFLGHFAEEIDKALGGLTREEQWVPVEESGHRWAGRRREVAEVCLKAFSVTGICHDPEVDSPLVRIEHEARWVSGWSEA
ncbi:hypothetical protein WHEELER_63 [Mycobacterium phage Wheeler]|uniref:hypothetical protein n=1 Tax=Mycobacterium phage Wheeler TaxID=1383054 RepID=UPI000388132C|nr:hypothetical protein WHEELER_63 [Mycobacterium phage Wheeler]AGT13854.1 hypothetical protein WHEELER_63 [Mycobacterium phage Wheeler]